MSHQSCSLVAEQHFGARFLSISAGSNMLPMHIHSCRVTSSFSQGPNTLHADLAWIYSFTDKKKHPTLLVNSPFRKE